MATEPGSGALARTMPLWHVARRSKPTLMCRRSSGVERALGKGEVECSIHSGGTINFFSDTWSVRPFAPALSQREGELAVRSLSPFFRGRGTLRRAVFIAATFI